MKNMMYAAAMWLLAASQVVGQNNALQIRVVSTGNTTGHIADLSVFNPTPEPKMVSIPASYIPSGGQYQPYIVPTPISTTVAPGSTANIPVTGYCADIFTVPVPAGHSMPPCTTWTTAEQNGFAGDLLESIQRISTTFDQMKVEGAITTPFRGNPEKEREAVIQQTFWIYAANLTAREYKKEDFSANTIRQFESVSGQKLSTSTPETRRQVEAGINDFWSTFEAVGTQAKVLKNEGGAGDGTIEISVKDEYCDCGNVTLKVNVFIKDPFQDEASCKEIGLDGGDNTRDTIEYKVIPNYEVRLEITDLVTKCTECNSGQCLPENVTVTVSSKGMAENKTEQVNPAGGKYSMPARTVAPLGKDKNDKELKTSDNPVRLYITVKYDCAKAPCKKKPCEKSFEITVPRK